MVRTWKHILAKMPLNQCHSYEAKIFLIVTYEQLRSIYKSLNKLFSKINYIDNKYSQSLGYIVRELLKIIKGNRNSTTKPWLYLSIFTTLSSTKVLDLSCKFIYSAALFSVDIMVVRMLISVPP